MTVQIDSLAIGTDSADIATADVDQLFDEVSTLDATILDAIERRDPEAAFAAARRHIEYGRTRLLVELTTAG